MKKIDKNAYNEAKYGRNHLMVFAIIALLLSLALLGGGIALTIIGAVSSKLSHIISLCIVGAILIIAGVVFTIFALIMLFTSFSMIKVKEGSVKDGNRAIGTVNIIKCDKCGEELVNNAQFCSKCGTPVENTVNCDCGAVLSQENEFCSQCGKKLK